MTKILTGLLSKNSKFLAKLQTSPHQLLNQTDSGDSDPNPILTTKLLNWQPKQKIDQQLLKTFLQRPTPQLRLSHLSIEE